MKDGMNADGTFGRSFEERVAARKAQAKRRRRRDAVIGGVLLALLGGGLFALKSVAGEEDKPSQAAPGDTAAPGPSPVAPSPADLGGSPVRADAMTASMLHGFHSGGPEQVEFIRMDLERMTSCAIAGFIDDYPREELPEVLEGYEDLYPSSEVGSAYEDGLAMIAVFVCPGDRP